MNLRQRVLALVTVAAALTALGAQPVLAAEPRFELQVPVLYYHHIKCAPPEASIPSLYECPEVFAEQMTYLRDHGWQAITVDDVADLMSQRRCPNPRQFVVSLDDGALDAYDTAAPILESLGMHGSFYPTLGNVGGLRTGKFTFDQMRDLVARGHAIGNHTQNHLNLKV